MSSASPTSPPPSNPISPNARLKSFRMFQHNCCGSNVFFSHFVRLFVPVHPHFWLSKILFCLMALPLVPLVLFRYLILPCQLRVLFFTCRRISREVRVFQFNVLTLHTYLH